MIPLQASLPPSNITRTLADFCSLFLPIPSFFLIFSLPVSHLPSPLLSFVSLPPSSPFDMLTQAFIIAAVADIQAHAASLPAPTPTPPAPRPAPSQKSLLGLLPIGIDPESKPFATCVLLFESIVDQRAVD